MRRLSLIAALLLASPGATQSPVSGPTSLPGTPDARAVVAGTYAIEPKHTQVSFTLDHFGISLFRGFFSGASGSLTIDQANLAKTVLSVTIPVASIHTTSDKLNEELVGSDWLDAAKYPQASFVSTKITPGPNNSAQVEGNFTLHGVTRPATMLVHFHGAGINPYTKVLTIGFDGRLPIQRSDFGVSNLASLVSDHVELTIGAAFEKQ